MQPAPIKISINATRYLIEATDERIRISNKEESELTKIPIKESYNSMIRFNELIEILGWMIEEPKEARASFLAIKSDKLKCVQQKTLTS